MFTGIVSAVGRIERITPLDAQNAEAGLRLYVQAGGLPLTQTKLVTLSRCKALA